MSNEFPSPANFENEKNKLLAFSKSLPAPPHFSRMQTEGKVFGFLGTSHNVTGSEINSGVISPMQEQFTKIHTVEKDIIKEFGTIYKTFETLDKEYIRGIVSNIQATKAVSEEARKAADKAVDATQKAELAQQDIKRTIKGLEITIAKLSEIKDSTNQKIDNLTNQIQNINKSIAELNAAKQLVNETNDTLQSKVEEFEKIKSSFSDNLNHLLQLEDQLQRKLKAGPGKFAIFTMILSLSSLTVVALHLLNII